MVGKHARPTAKRIQVWTQWLDMPALAFIGELSANPGRGKEIFSFEYSEAWLQNPNARLFDPLLALFPGVHYPDGEQGNFGAFLDSAPDRWGRVLMQRREAQKAREEARPEGKLLESDYLLGVFDGNRQGALRFKLDPNGPFLDSNNTNSCPPWASLRDLEHASLELERDNVEDNRNYPKWLNMLVAPGSSLGGARPKAGVVDESGYLWIAKFPSNSDHFNVGAWEMVVHRLAEKAGIHVAQAKTLCFSSKHETFLTKRFDRLPGGARIHFASAMTLLQKSDGDDASTGVSYLDLAAVLVQMGARPKEDLEQLWARIVFNICVSNTDDHLRNHGFLLEKGGWTLAPAYDMNPNSAGGGLKLNISETDNSQDLELAMQVAPEFRLRKNAAEAIVEKVTKVVSTWPDVANVAGISKAEQKRMAPAFPFSRL